MVRNPMSWAVLCALLSSAQIPAQSILQRFQATHSSFGTAIACAGDVDRDGVNDVIVGAGQENRARVHSGRTGSLLLELHEPMLGGFGNSVAGAGDVNRDGHADLLVGTTPGGARTPVNYVAAARVYSGADGSLLHSLAPPGGAHDFFGVAVAGVGDVDGDRVDDVAVGAPRLSTGGLFGNGGVEVFSGVDGRLIRSLRGTANNERFGESLAGVGDVDGDGYSDLLVGSRRGDGMAILISGARGATLRAFDPRSGSTPSFFVGNFNPLAIVGSSGDVDGDRIPDFVFGKPIDDTNGLNAGGIYVFSGADGSLLHEFFGDPCDRRGTYVALDDVNGDGHADVISGQANDVGIINRVTVYSGRTGRVIFDTSRIVQDATSAAPIGDLDGDGFNDVLVAADPLGPNARTAVVVSGGPALGAAAASAVRSAAGTPVDVLVINGSAGGDVRRVDVGLAQPVRFSVAQPPSSPTPGQFIVVGRLGYPGETEQYPIAGVRGALAIDPAPLSGSLFVLAFSAGGLASIFPAHAAPWTSPPVTIPVPVTFTVQGVYFDGSERATTNGVVVRVR